MPALACRAAVDPEPYAAARALREPCGRGSCRVGHLPTPRAGPDQIHERSRSFRCCRLLYTRLPVASEKFERESGGVQDGDQAGGESHAEHDLDGALVKIPPT